MLTIFVFFFFVVATPFYDPNVRRAVWEKDAENNALEMKLNKN